MKFVDSQQGVSLLYNNFTYCSGIRGIIEIEHTPISRRGNIIYMNNFTHNSGLFRANALNLMTKHEN